MQPPTRKQGKRPQWAILAAAAAAVAVTLGAAEVRARPEPPPAMEVEVSMPVIVPFGYSESAAFGGTAGLR